MTHTRDTGAGSIDSALTLADDGDRIVFETGGTVTLQNGPLRVDDKNLTIGTPESQPMTISAGNASSVFMLDGTGITVEFNNLAITSGSSLQGGGIHAGAGVSLDFASGVIISGNRTDFDDGGGVFAEAGDVHLGDGTAIMSNAAAATGGGLHLRNGNLSIGDNVSLSGNTAGTGGGGAYVIGALTAGDNVAIVGNTASGPGGGAYARGNVAFGDNARIENNTVEQGNGVYKFGGGIFVTGGTSTVFGNNIRIIGNTAHESGGGIFVETGDLTLGENATVQGNTAATGVGGGLRLSITDLEVGAGGVFSNNTAANSGGAVFSESGNLRFATGLTLNGNRAGTNGGGLFTEDGDVELGSGTNAGGNTAGGAGGAIFAEGKVTVGSLSSFADNRARIAGGAIYAACGGTLVGTSFTGNAAAGGGDGTGLGGAVYTAGDMEITDGGFIGNTALANAPGLGGRGGAVFVDADPTGTALVLTVRDGGSMTFSGNSHGTSATTATPNSVYFGNSSENAGLASLTVDVGSGGELYMADPLGSQPDALISGGCTLGNTSLEIDKHGLGTWRLAGQNVMGGKTEWRINEGTFHLFGEQHGSQPTRILMDAIGSSFKLNGTAHLALTPFTSPMEIRAETISLSATTSVSLAGHAFGPEIPYGERTILELNSQNLDNQSGVPVKNGTIEVGFYKYRYDNLRWVDGGSRLVVGITEAAVNREFACVCSVTGPMAAVLADGAGRMAFDRLDSRFRSPAPTCPQPGDGVWVSGTAAHSDFQAVDGVAGYDLNSFTTALGVDRRFGGALLLGIAGAYSRPDFKGGHTRFDADGYTGLLYGGLSLPLGVEASFLGGYGMLRFDQKRSSEGDWYSAKYNANILVGGFGIARRFDTGDRFSFRPAATYEHIRMKTRGYNEKGGLYGLSLADSPQTLHRVNAGAEIAYQAANCVQVSGRAWYQGVYGDTRSRVPTFFTNDPGRHIFVNTSHYADRHSVGLGGRITVPLGERTELRADGSWMSGKNASTVAGGLSISIAW